MIVVEFIKDILSTSLSLLHGSSGWLVVSYIIAGLLHDVISPVRFNKHLGNKKLSSILKATLSAMILPVCSCGAVPIGISLYYSGAYLGPTLAFMASSPFLNPLAITLSLGLLGPQITIINAVAGLTLPLIVGVIGNRFGGDELKKPQLEEEIDRIDLEESDNVPLLEKFKSGLLWVKDDLALTLSKYVVLGMVFGGFILTVFPDSSIQQYLGNPSMLSLGTVALLGTLMYVWAVGHIPFIAALIASGAAPGAAVTFLMSGAATDIPELYTIYKMIGKKSAAIYAVVITIYALIVGYITNLILMPGFEPAINYNRIDNSIESANTLSLHFPEPVKWICTIIVLIFFVKAMYPQVINFIDKIKGDGSDDDEQGCC